jgi:hypothetical protein
MSVMGVRCRFLFVRVTLTQLHHPRFPRPNLGHPRYRATIWELINLSITFYTYQAVSWCFPHSLLETREPRKGHHTLGSRAPHCACCTSFVLQSSEGSKRFSLHGSEISGLFRGPAPFDSKGRSSYSWYPPFGQQHHGPNFWH